MDVKDKVVFAAAITAAALAVAKLIADKESKVSEFRKDWIASFRTSLCSSLAEAHVIAGRIKIRREHNPNRQLSDSDLERLEGELTSHWTALRHSLQMVMLHLNFAETSLVLMSSSDGNRITPTTEAWETLSRSKPTGPEQLYFIANKKQQVDEISRASPAAVALVRTLDELRRSLLGAYADVGVNEKYKTIEDLILKATLLGNLVIKPEWNRIKRGERLHRYAIYGSVVLVVAGFYKLLGL